MDFSLTKENMLRAKHASILTNELHPFDQAKKAAQAALAGLVKDVDVEEKKMDEYMDMLVRLDSHCRKKIEEIIVSNNSSEHTSESSLNGFMEAILLSGSLRTQHDHLRQLDQQEDCLDNTTYVRDRKHIDEWLTLTTKRLRFSKLDDVEANVIAFTEKAKELVQVDKALQHTFEWESRKLLTQRMVLGDVDRVPILVANLKQQHNEAKEEEEEEDESSTMALCRSRVQTICDQIVTLSLGKLNRVDEKLCTGFVEAIRAIESIESRRFVTFAVKLGTILDILQAIEARVKRKDIDLWRDVQRLRVHAVGLERELMTLCSPPEKDQTKHTSVLDIMRVLIQAQDRSNVAREMIRIVETRQAHIEYELALCKRNHDVAIRAAKAHIDMDDLDKVRTFLTDVYESQSQVCEGILVQCFDRLEAQRQRLIFRWRSGQTWVGKLLGKYNLSSSVYDYMVAIEQHHMKIESLSIPTDEVPFAPPILSPYRKNRGNSPFPSERLYEQFYTACDHPQRRDSLRKIEQKHDEEEGLVNVSVHDSTLVSSIGLLQVMERHLRKLVALELKREHYGHLYGNPEKEEEKIAFRLAALGAETNLTRTEEGIRKLLEYSAAQVKDSRVVSDPWKIDAIFQKWGDHDTVMQALYLIRKVVKVLVNRSVLDADLWETNVELRGNGLVDRVDAFRKLIRLMTDKESEHQEGVLVRRAREHLTQLERKREELARLAKEEQERIQDERVVLNHQIRRDLGRGERERAVSLSEYEDKTNDIYQNEFVELETQIKEAQGSYMYLQSAISWEPASEADVDTFCTLQAGKKACNQFIDIIRKRARSALAVPENRTLQHTALAADDLKLRRISATKANLDVTEAISQLQEQEKQAKMEAAALEKQQQQQQQQEQEQEQKEKEEEQEQEEEDVLDIEIHDPVTSQIPGLVGHLYRSKPNRVRTRALHEHQISRDGQRESRWNSSTKLDTLTEPCCFEAPEKKKNNKKNDLVKKEIATEKATEKEPEHEHIVARKLEKLLAQENQVWAIFFPKQEEVHRDNRKVLLQPVLEEVRATRERTRKHSYFGLYDQKGKILGKSQGIHARVKQRQAMDREDEKHVMRLLQAHITNPLERSNSILNIL